MNTVSLIFDYCRSGDLLNLKKHIEAYPESVNFVLPNGFSPIIIASYNDQPEAAKILLENGAAINYQDQAGNTALMGVCFKGSFEMFQLLLKYGADIHLLNNNNANALTFAATFGKTEMARVLIEQGIHKFQVDNVGQTPYQKAVAQGNIEMMKLFED